MSSDFSRFARYAGDNLSRRARGASSRHRIQCFFRIHCFFSKVVGCRIRGIRIPPPQDTFDYELGKLLVSSFDIDTAGPGSPEQSELCENALDRPPALDTHVARGKCWSPLQPGIGYNTLTDLG
jgi:hypothetical protein